MVALAIGKMVMAKVLLYCSFAGQAIKLSHLRKPVEEKEVDDAVDDPDNNIKDAEDQSREKEVSLGLHHPKDNCRIDEDVRNRPNDCPRPVS